MRLFQILQLALPSLNPADCKIHLATWNGRENPLDVFLAGGFTEWQEHQNHKNFERPFIVSLIKMDGVSKWLFAGVYAQRGCSSNNGRFRYQTTEKLEVAPLSGRLVIKFARTGRQPYLKAENWGDTMLVHELRPQRLTIREFPGYASVIVSKPELDIIVEQQIPAWKSALQNVAGVYLITDTETGKHYVGSAYGEGGFWQRWSEYSATGHGHSKALKELLTANGLTHAAKFQFSILEIADTHACKDDVIARETHWKHTLCSREAHGGYNSN